MQIPQCCARRNSASEVYDTVPLAAALPDLEPVERLSREIEDLTTALKLHLSPEQFRLVWRLRDGVERLSLAEEILRERQFVERVAWHLPDAADAIRTVCEHMRSLDTPIDEVA